MLKGKNWEGMRFVSVKRTIVITVSGTRNFTVNSQFAKMLKVDEIVSDVEQDDSEEEEEDVAYSITRCWISSFLVITITKNPTQLCGNL